MKLENEVCRLYQAERLKELGVNQNSRYSWCGNKDLIPQENNPEKKPWVFVNTTEPANGSEEEHRSMVPSAKPFAAAFNVAELGVMLMPTPYSLYALPERLRANVYRVTGNSTKPYWHAIYNGWTFGAYATEADAKAAILIHQIEQGHTSVDEVNERLLNA